MRTWWMWCGSFTFCSVLNNCAAQLFLCGIFNLISLSTMHISFFSFYFITLYSTVTSAERISVECFKRFSISHRWVYRYSVSYIYYEIKAVRWIISCRDSTETNFIEWRCRSPRNKYPSRIQKSLSDILSITIEVIQLMK